MPKFVVKVEGRNFYGRHTATQKDRRYGFMTVVLVDSINEEVAEADAVNLLQRDDDLRDFPKNTKDDPPLLIVEDITEVSEWPRIAFPRSGIVWFPEEK